MFSNQVKGKFLICLFCLVQIYFTVFTKNTLSNETLPSKVVEAAVTGLNQFLYAIPTKDLISYGFSGKQDITQATLGDPIRVYTITPDRIKDYEQGMNFISIISPTNLWLFPVLSQGETKTLLTVDRMNGEWKAVAIGSAGLAKQLNKVKTIWPSSDGYEYTFVRIYQAKSDLMVLSKGATLKIKPLTSAILSLKLEENVKENHGNLYDPSEVMTKLIPVVQQGIQLNNMNK
jgi:hypothetical protein